MDSPTDLLVETAIKRWHRDQAIERVLNAEISSLSDESQGLFSNMWRVTLDFIFTSGDRATKRFIVKKPSSSELAKAFETELRFFKREVETYLGVLKQMEYLMSQHNDSHASMWPRLYGSQYDTLIFDDLQPRCSACTTIIEFQAKGYELVDTRVLMDLEESLLVIACLARFHALGMVLLDRGVFDRNEFGAPPMLQDIVQIPFMIDPMKRLNEAIRKTWGSEWLNIAAKMEGLMDGFPQRIDELYNTENSLMNTINHGDPKANNIMIKKDFRGRPMKCKMIDFQTTNYNSFTYDMHFFMMSSINPEIRRNNFNDLMEAYHSVLNETLMFYGYTKQIPSLSQIGEEVRRSSLLGLLLIPVTAVYASDAVSEKNGDCVTSGASHIVNAFNSETYHHHKIKEWFAQDIRNFVEKGSLY